MSGRRFCLLLLVVILVVLPSAAEDSGLVMLWPDKDNPTLKLTFGRFHNEGSYAGQMTLVSDVIVQNLSPKVMPQASLTVSLLDKDHVRIGQGLLVVSDLSPGESAKVLFRCQSVGVPATLSISGKNNGGTPTSLKTIPLQVVSEPAGASLKVDGKDQGLTPATVDLTVGNHTLELRKEGFALTTTPFDVAPDEAPGGSIKVTLGGLPNDVLVLRDGSSLSGDVLSMTIDSITIRVEGIDQKLDRNRVSKMFLVERIVSQPVPAVETPAKAIPTAKSQTQHQ